MVYITFMPTYAHIERYQADKQRFIDFGGSDNEQSIRRAFAVCLDSYCREHREKLALIDELDAPLRNRPDGTVKDSLRMARGYWEAKDTHDDLDAEIQHKLNRGYPQDNIIFEDSQTAVLIQNREEAMRADMSRPGELHRLIRSFLDYELPQIEEFRQAQRQFKADLPAVINNLREAIEAADADNLSYQAAAADFLAVCQQTISPAVSAADVREMLLQHILTQDIFLRVFAEDQFHRENNVARRLDALEQTFFTGDVRRQAIDRLRAYYGAIGRAADEIADYAEKQQFLKAIYEDFYKAYNPAAADRLGVVYTPNEVVDFIIRGTDYLLQKHFGRSLADDNVQILDPATGTGTFVTNLINYLPADRLEYKYLNEIHANEVAILPYYIANLNIEYTYKERTGQYRGFPNLCFVDTLDNMDWQQAGATSGAVTRQGAMNLGGVSEENWIRIQEQNEKTISVIIGNPPYNERPSNWNDFNPNRQYPEVDLRIRETYVAASTAQKTKQYDMYKRFIRWASDRLADDGIIAFVSNSAFLDSHQDDGFRQIVAQEFNELWAIDLKGNARTSGERRRREGGNIFDDKIRVGIAIYFLVRRQGADGFRVFYTAVDDRTKSADKIDYIKSKPLSGLDLHEIVADAKGNWLNQSKTDFERLIPIANRRSKLAKNDYEELTVFGLFSNGVKTDRDEWVFDFDVSNLRAKALFFSDSYNGFLDAKDESYNPVIKWSRDLRNEFRRGRRIVYNDGNRVQSLYRPFVVKHHFADFTMNDVLTRNHSEMFGSDLRQYNRIICFRGLGSNKPFDVLATDKLNEHQLLMNMQCLPLYRYTDTGERVSNITGWGIRLINEHYRKEWGKDFDGIYPDGGITAEDIFAYTYAVLHDPVYRHDYSVDLLREFPRLPLYRDFDVWARMGQELLDLHIGFESAEPYNLRRVDQDGPAGRPILRAEKERGAIVVDSKTTLTGVPSDAWRYRLGSRSALEWVLDQYKEKKPRDPTIAEKFNTYRFADHKERVIDLLQRVCTVSVQTMAVVDGMAYWEGDRLIAVGDRDRGEWSMLGLDQLHDRPENEDWLAAGSET